MPEEDDADERHNDAFFDQLFAQRCDGALDQIAAIISRHDAHTGWQRRFDLVDFLFDPIDNVECVLAIAHHYDATHGLAFAVQIRDAAPDVTAEMHVGDVFQINWRAVVDFEDNVFDVLDFFDVAAAADEVLGCRDFEHASADIGVTHFDRVHDVAERNVVGDEGVWIEIDLVLLYETADRRHFRHAFHGRERVAEIPILNRAQLR